ncbi:MAG: hypothetical protein WC889_05885 [Myxococcota bacterium]
MSGRECCIRYSFKFALAFAVTASLPVALAGAWWTRAGGGDPRLWSEFILAAIAAFFCGLAVGVYYGGTLGRFTSELRGGARRFASLELKQPMSPGPPGEFAGIVSAFNEAATRLDEKLDGAGRRDGELLEQVQSQVRRVETVGLRLEALEAISGARTAAPLDQARAIALWFDRHAAGSGKKVELCITAASWPAGAGLPLLLLLALDLALALDGNSYKLDIGGRGFSLAFNPGAEGTAAAFEPVALRAGSCGATFDLDCTGGRATVSVAQQLT